MHGKNHHVAGSFGGFVESLTLARSDCATAVRISPDHPRFATTVAGLGLSGLMLDTDIRLKRIPGPGIEQEIRLFGGRRSGGGIDGYLELDADSKPWNTPVGWIDTLDRDLRGVFFVADIATVLTNGWRRNRRDSRCQSMRRTGARPLECQGLQRAVLPAARDQDRAAIGDPDLAVLLPARRRERVEPRLAAAALSSISSWCPRGSTRQFRESSRICARRAWPVTSRRDQNVRRCTLARHHELPMAGTTVALDIPAPDERDRRALDRADAMVADVGGRVSPAKDARACHGDVPAFLCWRELEAARDPAISSFWRRVTADVHQKGPQT